MKQLIETMQLYKVHRLFAGLGVICLLSLAVPTDSFACHKGVTHGPKTCPL